VYLGSERETDGLRLHCGLVYRLWCSECLSGLPVEYQGKRRTAVLGIWMFVKRSRIVSSEKGVLCGASTKILIDASHSTSPSQDAHALLLPVAGKGSSNYYTGIFVIRP